MAWNTLVPSIWPATRFYGHLDVARNGTISGWVLDRRNPRARVSVLIKSQDFSVISTADNYREDLVSALGYDGYHGFSVTVGAAISEGDPVHCGVADSSYTLRDSPRIMQVSGIAYLGHVDEAANGIVSGWAFDRKAPNSPVSVLVKSGDLRLPVMAESYRSDLVRVLGSSGFHGFQLHAGTAIPDGAAVECHVANTDHMLANSPTLMKGSGSEIPYGASGDVGHVYAQALISGAYRAIFKRQPAHEEVAWQMGRFAGGRSIPEFLDELINSTEAKGHRQLELRQHTQSLATSYQILEAELIERLSRLGVNVQLTKVSTEAEEVLRDPELLRQALRALR